MNNIYKLPDISDSLILQALRPKDRLKLLTGGQKRAYRKGELIFSRGDEGAWALFIEEGLIEVSVNSLSGRKSVLNHMEQGDILGEIALLDKQPRSAEATALTDVKGTVVHRQSVYDTLKNNSEACFLIMETLCSRVRNASEMFETLSLTSASARLARCLIRISKKWGQTNTRGEIHIHQKFSQADLGELAGIARENVNRHMQHWIQEDLIVYHRGDITLIDPEAFNEIAELY